MSARRSRRNFDDDTVEASSDSEGKKRKSRAADKAAAVPEEDEEVEDSDGLVESEEVTRCICGHEELHLDRAAKALEIDQGLFIQCDSCSVWQHGYCVGMYQESEVPDVYYCEKCRPDLHQIFLRPSGQTSIYNKSADDDEDEENEDGNDEGNGSRASVKEEELLPPKRQRSSRASSSTASDSGTGATRESARDPPEAMERSLQLLVAPDNSPGPPRAGRKARYG